VYFGGLGLGYLMIEMALLQKFGLFLGHPNRALSVVLAALLVASGPVLDPMLLSRDSRPALDRVLPPRDRSSRVPGCFEARTRDRVALLADRIGQPLDPPDWRVLERSSLGPRSAQGQRSPSFLGRD
jgi:hypothetical protein